MEPGNVWVQSILQLKQGVHQHQVDPDQSPIVVVFAEVHEEDLPLEGERDETHLLVKFHLIALELLLFVKVAKILVVLVIRVNDPDDENHDHIQQSNEGGPILEDKLNDGDLLGPL